MPSTPRHLILSSDEKTWKFDRPVLFLGSWCQIFDRKHIWEDMDAILASPYGVELKNKDIDHKKARLLEKKLFLVLCNQLNQQHNLKCDTRFWQIVFGHWLRRYVDTMLNRVKTLEQCLKKYNVNGLTSYTNDDYVLATIDSYSSIFASTDSRWNHALYIRILNLLGKKIQVEHIVDSGVSKFIFNPSNSLKRIFFKWGYKKIEKLFSYMQKDSDAFIISSYLSKFEEVKLQIALRQIPQIHFSSELNLSSEYDSVLRKKLSIRVQNRSNDSLEYILTAMVFELLPICYLEGFSELSEHVEKQSWPKNPKFIFTSNNFNIDETFKLWAAIKTQSSSKYFIGQHGNNYGTHRFLANPSVEEMIADKFITWGWRDGLPQHAPAFIFKNASKSKFYLDLKKKDALLLVENMSPHQIETWDQSAEHEIYMFDQINFIKKLKIYILKSLIIRLHPSYIYNKPYEQIFWGKLSKDIKIDAGSSSFVSLTNRSRLVVFSYDSTGLLENLSRNIPTLAFWQNGLSHLRDSARPFYQLLVDVEIIHPTHESIAKKVNEVWGDVDTWWNQDKLQNARKIFCNRYARKEKNRIFEIKKILLG